MVAAKLRTFLCTPNKTLLALPPVAGTLTRGLTHFVRILAHVLAPQSLALCSIMKIYNCPVCGWGPYKEPYCSVQELRWSYDICECCGCEFGLDDNLIHYQEWLDSGCEWFEPELKPSNWKIENQIKFQIRPWPPVDR